MALIERRGPAEVTVTVRHRCPDFAFGSILGPYDKSAWWWSPGLCYLNVLDPAREYGPDLIKMVTDSVIAALAGQADLRRHLDELAELPDVP